MKCTFTKERFWWRLRKAWHMPNFHHECVKPESFIQYNEFHDVCGDYKYRLHLSYSILFFRWQEGHVSIIKPLIMTVLRHTEGALKRIFWGLMWLQPLRCNGNNGGWRTHLCNWLENKARSYESY